MVEELKRQGVPASARAAQTIAEDMAMWFEKAPKCKCQREKVIYICQDEKCHKGDEK